MSKIQVLSSDLINKIAAGEVVERPSSVVKELVENSIDAGASHIIIEIQDAGKKLIRITDDGCGMNEEEIKLSLQRHSTSKISSLDDLFNIKTLGFRGEALPSIDSISKMAIEPNPSGRGLTIKVRDLFCNTPVRLKFLKSNFTELSHIQNHVIRFILSSPQIAFKLIIDGKESLASPGNGKLFDAVFSVYGIDVARELVEVKSEKVFGFVSKPTFSRLDRGYQNYFVNSRSIQNFLLSRAVEDSYRNLIPNNRYPIAIIFIEIPSSEVDVNVHPAKREVKFLKTKEVMDAVREAVNQTLKTGFGMEAGLKEDSGLGTWSKNIIPDQLPMINGDMRFQIPTQQPFSIEITDVLPIIPLYQLLDTYIICTDGEELVLIDQHAAHERILFDRISNGERGMGNELHTLLIPETIELNMTDSSVVDNNLSLLLELGFDIAEFGNKTYILRALPAFLAKESPKELLNNLISELGNDEYKNQPDKNRDRINKFLACHGAVKAGDSLSISEIQGLIKDLYKTQNPTTCPHGRPTMVRIGKNSLEKMFERA